MEGRTRNRLGKVERNKKVKAGPCIFPFKYKREEHRECLETEKGAICATSVNPKTGTMVTYGYCEEYGSPKPVQKRATLKKPRTSGKKRLSLIHI